RRTQRGHLILDRASNADRVWVTSDSTVGIGSEGRGSRVTVTGSSDATVGGAQMPEQSGRATTTSTRSGGGESRLAGKLAESKPANTATDQMPGSTPQAPQADGTFDNL